MTQPRPPEHDPLDEAFTRLRDDVPSLPDGLMDRVMSDALAEQPQPTRTPFWRQVVSTLGGWPALAGLAATACVGIWIGGALSSDLMFDLGLTESASLDVGASLGAFDLLLVDG